MKQYLLSVYHPEGDSPEPEVMDKIRADVSAVNIELQQAGAWVFAGGLYPSSTATVVRVDGGDVLITDGPFVEGKEHVGGFWVIKTSDLDSALEWGRKATRACTVPIEVRPFRDEASEVGPEIGSD
ncbi:MAG TPA: YciI family protein [Streptosporangiaceae bacterium]|nr:YciI family protein [Streptosporangiaceae bacterium]